MSFGLLATALLDRGFCEETVTELLPVFKSRQLEKGEFFITADSLSVPLGFVVSGLFYEYVTDEDGRLFISDFTGPREFLTCNFRWGKPANFFSECLKSGEVFIADYKEASVILKDDEVFKTIQNQTAEDCLTGVNRRLAAFATMEAPQRYEVFKKQYGGLAETIPRYLAAAYIGVTPTQLSRIRKKELS